LYEKFNSKEFLKKFSHQIPRLLMKNVVCIQWKEGSIGEVESYEIKIKE